ncbi:MAG: DNA polymerase III subunit beta [Schwartzia sp.]|nr:DNA polymerase III subunit beta [Schwartzia sp. (in: firmicutes)]
MKFSCMKSELAQAIQIAGRSIASKPQTPIMSGIFMYAHDDMLEIQATDYEIGVMLHIPAEIEVPGQAVVSGRYLQEVVRTLPEEEVSIAYEKSTNICTIASGRSNFNLLSMKSEDYPQIRRIKEGKTFKVSSAVLGELIRRTIFACATNETRPVFTGALLEVEGNNLSMAATDVHRLALNKESIEEEQKGKESYIVPKRVLEEVRHVFGGEVPEDVTVKCTRSEMSFETEKVYLTSRLIDGQFPDYRRVIPSEFGTRVTLKHSEFFAAVSRVGLIARASDYNIIKLIFNMGQVHISSDNPIVGKAEETVPAVIDGEDIKIALNASYLIDVLKILNGENIVISLNGTLKPAAVRDPEKEDFIYIITPVQTRT